MKNSLFVKTAVALALAAPLLASAESQLVTGTATDGPGAQARLNFRIEIPAFIALKVGTGDILSNDNTVNEVAFVLTEPQVSVDGTVSPSTGSPVQVALLSNVGSVDFGSAGADLSDGTSTIPLSRIAVTTPTGNLAHPAFNAAATPVLPTSGRVVNRSGTWAFSYNHQGATAPVGAGTYTTQVTYTAVAP